MRNRDTVGTIHVKCNTVTYPACLGFLDFILSSSYCKYRRSSGRLKECCECMVITYTRTLPLALPDICITRSDGICTSVADPEQFDEDRIL